MIDIPVNTQQGQSSLMADVYKIVGGTGLAQILIALATPILSRLYSQDSFGISTIFISLTLITSTIVCLRYEFAILLPAEERDGVHLLRISLLAIALVTSLSYILILLTQTTIIDLVRLPALAPYLLLVPVALLGLGIYQAFTSWTTRTKNYWHLSLAKIISAVITIAFQVGFGFGLRDNPTGLVIGFLAGYMAGGVFLGIYVWLTTPGIHAAWDWKAMWENLVHYRKFPLLDTWGTLINAVSWQVPPLLLAGYFSATQAGNYSMAYRLIQLPVSFIGLAIGQVFSQRAASAKEDPQKLIQVTRDVLHRLIGLGIFPALLLTLLGRDLFIVILGSNWDVAGTYVQILGIWMFFWFTSWPLGMLANIKAKQGTNLVLQLIILISRVASLIIGGLLGSDLLAIILFSVSGILFYLFYAVVCLRMIDYPLQTTVPFLAQQSIPAVVAVGLLYALSRMISITPLGMLGLGVIVSGLYAALFMRKSLM